MTDYGSYSIGQNIQLYKRLVNQLDARADAGHALRLKTENSIVKITPTWDNDNIKRGTLAGAIMAGVTAVVDNYALPTSADTEIVDSEPVQGGVKYTVNVDSSFKNQARFRAMMEAGQGFVSLATDRFGYGSEDVMKKRPARDTWQFEIIVKEGGADDDLGLNIF
jgi:hypothetical protein